MSVYSSSESEKDPFHQSDNTDGDPDYVENDANNKNSTIALQVHHLSNEDSSSDAERDGSTDEKVKQNCKKRKRMPNKWKRNLNKWKRNSGKQYVNSAGRAVAAKIQGSRCQCRNQCYDKFTEIEKNEIFVRFYAMEEKNMQDTYLSTSIDVKHVSRRRKSTIMETKKYSYYYNIKIGTKMEKVCRMAFCNLHAVHKSRVLRICQGRAAGKLVGKDARGTHQNRPNKKCEDIIASINEHIRSFPLREAHYSRNENKKKYLSADLNIRKMYHLYLEKYEPEQYILLIDEQRIKPKVTYDYYYRHFMENFNISFGFPRSDTCATCDEIKIQIDNVSSKEEKQNLMVQRELHLRKAQAFYDDLKEKIELAKTDPTVETICFDYQQNLPVPVLTTGAIFYARQIWVFNQCFHSCSDDKSVHYMFDETIAKKGCIETASFLKHFIEKYIKKTVKTLYIFTDNCAGQNKNSVVVYFLLALMTTGIFSKIVHHLPEPGHSFLPCDRDFGQIEKAKRKKELLYVPEEWYSLVQKCRKKFIVERVTQGMIFDFKAYLDPYFKKSCTVRKKQFSISKYRIFVYDSAKTDKVFVTEHHNVNTVTGYPLRKKTETVIDLNGAPLAYNGNLPLKYKKYDSIMPLVHKYVPLVHLPFYENIKRSEDNEADSD